MQTYSDDQFTTLISNGAAPSAVILAAGEDVPFEILLSWCASRQDLTQKVAAHAAELKAAKEAAENAPIKVRSGRDEGTILKSGKNRGKPGEATGAVLEISGAPRVFLPCTPGQIAAVLSNPLLALKLAIEMDRGEHDGRGYDRDPEYSAMMALERLSDLYTQLDIEAAHLAAQESSHAPDAVRNAPSVVQDSEALTQAV
jgi:hypothetical protein